MKEGKNIQELAAELARQANAKRDYIEPTTKLSMEDDGSTMSVEGRGHFDINTHAHGQIAERLEIPRAYYNRMRENDPGLLAHNVNTWLQKKPERRMLRTMVQDRPEAKPVLRAFLSDRYRRLDNAELVSAVFPRLISAPVQVQIASLEVTETRLYMKFVVPSIQAEVKKGEVVRAGAIIQNSEIGSGAVSVLPFTEVLWCTNGATHTDFGQRRHHVGRANGGEESVELYRDETLQADDKAFWMKVSDTVDSVLTESTFKVIVQRMQQAAGLQIQGDPVKSVELVSKRYGIDGETQTSVLQSLIRTGDLSLWGLSQAITQAAGSVNDYDEASRLETAGGNILTLSPADWKVISTAA